MYTYVQIIRSQTQLFRKIDNKRALDADDPTIEVLTSSDDDSIL